MGKSFSGPILLLFILILTGSLTTQAYASVKVSKEQLTTFLKDKPERLKPGYARILEEGQRNSVLSHMRVGLDALQLDDKEAATESFDSAISGIESVYADNPNAQKARQLWYEEGMKDFKGEPYERAMAYYYRGLLYMWKSDYENARACFRSGVLQDAFAEEEQYRCDFALLIFLEGWTSMMIGDKALAEEAWQEIKKLRPDFEIPDPSANTLLIVETGTSPRKVSDGIGHNELKFFRGRNFEEVKVEISIDNKDYAAVYPMEDIAWQAMTRGGRQIDKILQGKVAFRKTNEQMGSVLTDTASGALLISPLFTNAAPAIQGVSAGLGLLGVAQLAIASKTKPHADTRYWSNLCDGVHIAAFNLKQGEHSICFRFMNKSGEEINQLQKTINVQISKDKPTLIWERSREQIYSDQIKNERGEKL